MSKESKCPSSGANNKKPFYKKLWFFVIIIIVAIVAISMISKNQKEKFSWDEVKLCNRLPEPTSNVGTIISNNSWSQSFCHKIISVLINNIQPFLLDIYSVFGQKFEFASKS